MQLSYKPPLWFYPAPIDFRKQIDGLVLLISDSLGKQPTSGELFIFRNRGRNKLKLLWYDNNGFWLCYKRIEKGKLLFPSEAAEVLSLSHDELSWLLSGLDFSQKKSLATTKAIHFY